MVYRRQLIGAALASAALPLVTRTAQAAIIDRQAHIIVGFAAGGGTDLSARLFAAKLSPEFASAVIVENKTGVGGRLAVEYVKTAPPDGSVMLFTTDFPITLYPHIYKRLSYDPVRDFIPVASLTRSVLCVSVGPAVPSDVTTVKGFVEWAKRNPEKANFATTGNGGTPHFVGVMLANESGTPLTAVHYRGGAPALQDLIGGHVSMSVNPNSEAIPLAAGGAIRILGVASEQRSRFLPNTPTLREQGYDVALNIWTGVFLPAKTPASIVGALNAALGQAARAPDMVEAQSKFGNEMTFMAQPAFADEVRRDIETWGAIVKASGFEPED